MWTDKVHGKRCEVYEVYVFAEHFVEDAHRAMLIVERHPDAMLDRFAGFVPPVVRKCVGKGET